MYRYGTPHIHGFHLCLDLSVEFVQLDMSGRDGLEEQALMQAFAVLPASFQPAADSRGMNAKDTMDC